MRKSDGSVFCQVDPFLNFKNRPAAVPSIMPINNELASDHDYCYVAHIKRY
ncbi:hypothetical protein ALQ73_200070 [Pseudomonas savastanoi pv. glycinea]|uniref:Uncharacterized protein n=1 Tax=Pseudomonas savastanoi pv. glycinea TaxID=318 RepID=A0A3M3G9W0_PSESG|nr:hypothetical protein ALQ73_200070 [Pseudomonas savastanoi pv. glycinea]